MKFDVTVHADSFYTREIDPNDSWDIGDQALNIRGVTITATDKEYGWEVNDSASGEVCVLVEHYSDGCTFGDEEYAEVKGVFRTRVEAEQFAKSINTNHGYFGSHIGFLYFTEEVP